MIDELKKFLKKNYMSDGYSEAESNEMIESADIKIVVEHSEYKSDIYYLKKVEQFVHEAENN